MQLIIIYAQRLHDKTCYLLLIISFVKINLLFSGFHQIFYTFISSYRFHRFYINVFGTDIQIINV